MALARYKQSNALYMLFACLKLGPSKPHLARKSTCSSTLDRGAKSFNNSVCFISSDWLAAALSEFHLAGFDNRSAAVEKPQP
jgi:hypothetical protein